jgi:hypothetical protein
MFTQSESARQADGDYAMKRDITERALGASEEGLFDNWFDPIEAALRSRVRVRLE